MIRGVFFDLDGTLYRCGSEGRTGAFRVTFARSILLPKFLSCVEC